MISLLIVGGTHFLAEIILPDLRSIFLPPVTAPLLLAFGIWVGFKRVQFGGNYGDALVAGAIVGLLPVIVEVFGFGILLNRGVAPGVLAGVFGFAMIFYGSLVGGGFALSKSRIELLLCAERQGRGPRGERSFGAIRVAGLVRSSQ